MNTLLNGPVSERAINILQSRCVDRSATVSSRWNFRPLVRVVQGFCCTVHSAGMLARGQVYPTKFGTI